MQVQLNPNTAHLFQVIFAFILASLTQAIDHQAYYAPQLPSYHHIQPAAPAPSKGAVSFASFTAHHSPAQPAAIHHLVAPIHQAAVAPGGAAASSYATYSSSISHHVEPAKPVPVFHYAAKPAVAASFVEAPRVAPVVQVSHHVAPVAVAHEAHQDHGVDYYVSCLLEVF